MGQLYMQRFEYRGAISKSEFDEAWSGALKAFAKERQLGRSWDGRATRQNYGTSWGGYALIEVDDPEAFARYQVHHIQNYSHVVHLTFDPVFDLDKANFRSKVMLVLRQICLYRFIDWEGGQRCHVTDPDSAAGTANIAIALSNFMPSSAFAAQDCAGLANLKIDNTNLLSAVEVPRQRRSCPRIVVFWGMFVRPSILKSACRSKDGTASFTWSVAASTAAFSLPKHPAFFNAMNFRPATQLCRLDIGCGALGIEPPRCPVGDEQSGCVNGLGAALGSGNCSCDQDHTEGLLRN